MFDLPSICTRSAAKLPVINIGTIFSFDNQFAIGKVRIVITVVRHNYVGNGDVDRIWVSFVTVLCLTSVPTRVWFSTIENNQSIAIGINLKW
jgi:hypothetical protein